MQSRISHDQKLNIVRLLLLCMLCLSLFLPAASVLAAEGFDKAASKKGKFEADAVETYGMTPIAGSYVADGMYDVEVRSSSRYFRIGSAKLMVSDGNMQVEIKLDSTAYVCVYPGLGIDAAKAERSAYIDLEKVDYGTKFTMEVPALNQAFPCAAFSKKRKKWYDRALLVDAKSLPAEALSVKVPAYDLIEEALDAYQAEDAAELEAARDAFFAEKAAEAGVEAPASGTAGNGTASGATGDEAAGGGASPTADAASGGSADAGSGGEAAGGVIAGTGGGQNTESVIAVMDEETMDAMPEAIEVDLPDGEYAIEVTMTGGSGRASISSPTWFIVRKGKAFAKLLWSSTYYDYMIVGERTYLNQTTDGSNSTFIIPVTSLDEPMDVVADTTAMGDPLAIEYMLTFYEDTIGSKGQIPQEAAKKVLLFALLVMIGGGIINYFVKRNRV